LRATSPDAAAKLVGDRLDVAFKEKPAGSRTSRALEGKEAGKRRWLTLASPSRKAPPEGIGDDHRISTPTRRTKASRIRRPTIGVLGRSAGDFTARHVRDVDAGVGAHESVGVSAMRTPWSIRTIRRLFSKDDLDETRILPVRRSHARANAEVDDVAQRDETPSP